MSTLTSQKKQSGWDSDEAIQMADRKKRAAAALWPVLSAFQGIEDQRLQAVWHVFQEGSLHEVVLKFESVSLAAMAASDDSIGLDLTRHQSGNSDGVDVSELDPWRAFIGKPFGWGWITMNQQGYCDGILLSFEEVAFPELVLNVVAASIKIGRIRSIVSRAKE